MSNNLVKGGNFNDLESGNKQSKYTSSITRYVINLLLLLMFLLIVPLIEIAVGGVYLNTTTCTVHSINGTKILLASGVFGILYLISYIVHAIMRPFSLKKTLLTNLAESYVIFKIITFIHCSLLLIFMILEFTFLNGCTDLIERVAAGLWLSALTTLFAILYVIYRVLAKIFC